MFRLRGAFISSEEEQSPLMVTEKTVSMDSAFENLLVIGSTDPEGIERREDKHMLFVPPLFQGT